jgi:DHA1 family tetracycline resistance protein-like MFS transporter
MVLYTTYRYGWSQGTIGLTLAFYGALAVIVGGGLVRPAAKRLGERRMLLVGLFCGGAGFAIMGFAPTGSWSWAALPVLALMGFVGPAAQAIMTRLVPPDEQGRLQGAGSSVQSLAGLVGPGLFTAVFAAGVRGEGAWHLPGAPFLLAASIMVLGGILALAVGRRVVVAVAE